MSNHQNSLIVLILLLFLVIGCGDPLIKVTGTIKDKQNQSLSNASVIIKKRDNGEIRNATQERITKDDGIFEFTLIGNVPENCFIIVKKDGFKLFEKDLKLEPEKPNTVEIVLEPETK